MKAHEYISRLDEARTGRRMSEDTAPVAPAPSHAPTSGKDYTTTGKGSSEDQGETVKKGYKQPSGDIPAPVAPAPSHAPTSGKDATTTGQGKSEDEGEKVSKEAMKEAINRLLDGDGDVNDLLSEAHKPDCKCGFCERMRENKGNKGKKKEDDKAEKVQEGGYMGRPGRGLMGRPHMGSGGVGMGMKRPGRMNFRQQVRPQAHPGSMGLRPKATINPNQPAMERLDSAGNSDAAIQEMADRLLEAPGID